MAFYPQYPGYQPYYQPPEPDQLAQLRQSQFQPPPQTIPQQMPVQPVQTFQTPQSQQSTCSGMIWVNSKADADAFAVLPGSAVALWDSNNPVVYLRQADSTGKPSTKVYDLVERTDNRSAQQQNNIDLNRYLTIEAAEEMIEQRVNEILSERLKRPSRAAKQKEDTDNG